MKINDDADELAAIAELKAMPKDQLFLVEHTVWRWPCCVLGCDRFCRIKDFGISPEYYTRWGWHDLTVYQYFCCKHWKYYKRVPSKLIYKLEPAIMYITPDATNRNHRG